MGTTEQQNQRRVWILITIIAVIALIIGVYLQRSEKQQRIILNQGTILPAPVPLTSFQLKDDQDKVFTNRNLIGHWSLLFFGFTHCNRICPTTLHELNQAYQVLEKSVKTIAPQIVFISVDPKRDTPKQLQHYLASFNTNFVGATGSETEIRKLTDELGIAYLKALKETKQGFNLQHSGSIIVVNPYGEWVAVLSTPHQGRIIAKDFEIIQRHL